MSARLLKTVPRSLDKTALYERIKFPLELLKHSEVFIFYKDCSLLPPVDFPLDELLVALVIKMRSGKLYTPVRFFFLDQ